MFSGSEHSREVKWSLGTAANLLIQREGRDEVGGEFGDVVEGAELKGVVFSKKCVKSAVRNNVTKNIVSLRNRGTHFTKNCSKKQL